MAESRTETITLGTAIFTELKNPGLIPLQSRPVHAVSQALTHGSKVRLAGQLNRLPRRISGMVFNEVTIITHKGTMKNNAARTRKA